MLRLILTILVVGAGTAPPTRTVINFGTAAVGPRSAFSSVHHFGVTIVARGRSVATLSVDGREHVLLVVPTREGGFCTSLSGPYGGTSCPLTAVVRGPDGVLAPDMVGDAGGPIMFAGYFTFPSAGRLLVTYQDGERATIPFVWVTGPIRAGFFLYDLSGHRRAGHRPAFVTLLDSHGRQLAERQLP